MEIKFNDFEYRRPDMEILKEEFRRLLSGFNMAKSAGEQYDILRKLNELRNGFESMNRIASIRYTIDTKNKYYSEEHDFFDSVMPEYSGLVNGLYKSLLSSEFRDALEDKCGKQLFDLAKVSIKTFSPEITEDLKLENHLVTDYVKLVASAKIMFEGQERNLAGMSPFMQSENRELRKSAYEARWKFFEDNEKEFDRIFDELVRVRTKIAKKLGYKNFIELGYDRMRRTDYNWNDVQKFRDGVEKYIVPVTETLRDMQKERLGLEQLRYYDLEFNFKSGNPSPKGDPDWIVGKAKKMYGELSSDTKEFMNLMINRELMSLDNRKGKAAGGYCSFIPNYDSPFIFTNMNGTEDDIRVLTHEAGHAFQVYESMGFEIPEYVNPTLEACEVHSMSMEFITYPWMQLFFEVDTDKYFYSHVSKRLSFIPYGVTVDEFQHKIYENPDATPDERKKMWRDTEKKYLPHLNYENNGFLERGCFWFHQGHIFKKPFYYIDYCLAQICALQFWRKCNHDRDIAWEDYLRLCKEGGSKPFLELLKTAKIESPFEENTVESIIKYSGEWLTGDNKVFDFDQLP